MPYAIKFLIVLIIAVVSPGKPPNIIAASDTQPVVFSYQDSVSAAFAFHDLMVQDAPKPKPIKPTPVAYNTVWDHLAQCESSGNWADTAGMFEGGLQFLHSTWIEYGGATFAQHAYEATREQQILVATRALAGRPDWSAWPVCSIKLGLR
jgi:hypothetical protein